MRNLLVVLLLVGVVGPLALVQSSGRAEAVVHEIVGAYCSGGGVGVIGTDGDLEPPGLAGGSNANANNFAKPVIVSGAVDVGTFTTTDKPNLKYPAGVSVFGPLGTPDHPSTACKAMQP